MQNSEKIKNFDDIKFDNRMVRELPADPDLVNSRRQVLGACYSKVKPTPVSRPVLVGYSKEMADRLEFDDQFCRSQEFTHIFSGNMVLDGMDPYATCYGGHQFGHWAGQLGDGRAINLGEVVNSRGEHWTLQLKGAGLTPYSRTADGLAVLRSSVREFLCSEAMFHLGVPTTRALSLIMTGEQVTRDMFYDGNPELEPGAIVCRVAPSFTRFGNFQLFSARHEFDLLKTFTDFTIRHEFPELGEPCPEVYLRWFEVVCKRTAELMVHWFRVGFVHGVMNTDNMSILGLTIDYGPYGWLEDYDPNWTPNTTDAMGRRYRFGNQAQIAFWNLGQLANAIYPLVNQVEPLQHALSVYSETYDRGWQQMMMDKLGIKEYCSESDDELMGDLFALLRKTEMDMTLFFRTLSDLSINLDSDQIEDLTALFISLSYSEFDSEKKHVLVNWLTKYAERIRSEGVDDDERQQRMNQVNPKFVLRNYLAQQAIDKAEQGDFSMVHELLEVMRHPYDEQPGKQSFAEKRPEWAKHKPGCSMLSCSS